MRASGSLLRGHVPGSELRHYRARLAAGPPRRCAVLFRQRRRHQPVSSRARPPRRRAHRLDAGGRHRRRLRRVGHALHRHAGLRSRRPAELQPSADRAVAAGRDPGQFARLCLGALRRAQLGRRGRRRHHRRRHRADAFSRHGRLADSGAGRVVGRSGRHLDRVQRRLRRRRAVGDRARRPQARSFRRRRAADARHRQPAFHRHGRVRRHPGNLPRLPSEFAVAARDGGRGGRGRRFDTGHVPDRRHRRPQEPAAHQAGQSSPRRRPEQHESGPLHVRQRQPPDGLEPALHRHVPHRSQAGLARLLDPRPARRAPRRRHLSAQSRRLREQAARGDRRGQGLHAEHRARRRPHHRGGQPADGKRRLGGDARGHHRAQARRA